MTSIMKIVSLLAAFFTIYSTMQYSTPSIDFLLYTFIIILLLVTFETSAEHIHNYSKEKEKKTLSLLEILILAFFGWLGLKFSSRLIEKH